MNVSTRMFKNRTFIYFGISLDTSCLSRNYPVIQIGVGSPTI